MDAAAPDPCQLRKSERDGMMIRTTWAPAFLLAATGLGANLPDARAATVRFGLVIDQPAVDGRIVVAPGQKVPYRITALIQPSDPNTPDNDGAAFLSISLQTDLGVAQAPATLDPLIARNFTFVPSGGTSQGDDLVQIGGAQNTLSGSAIPGIALNQPQVIASGELATPASEGLFSLSVSGSANVLRPGSTSLAMAATALAGEPLTLQTLASAAANPLAAPMSAAVRFGLATTATVTDGQVIVAPGTRVPYQITAVVTTTDPLSDGVSTGLALFRINLSSNLTVPQSAVVFDSAVAGAFTVLPNGGIPVDDDLTAITGGQPLAIAVVPDIGTVEPQVIAGGELATPQSEGVFTISVTGQAAVLDSSPSRSLAVGATMKLGPSLVIRTSTPATGQTGDDTTTNAGGTDTNTGDTTTQPGENTTTTTTTTQPAPKFSFSEGLLIGLGILLVIIGLGWWGGGLIAALGLAFLPLIALLFLHRIL